MMRQGLTALIALLMANAPATAGEEKRDARFLASQVAAEVIAPKFAALDKAFAAQAAAWSAGCGSAQSLRDAFQQASDAWAQAEFFRAGPLSQQTRAERIDYWPDPRGAAEKGLRVLLAAPDAATPEKIASESVAVQGLPALERLLYAAEGSDAKTISDKECSLGRAIASNLANIAGALDTEWNDPKTGEAARLQAASQDEAKGREGAVALLTDLVTGIRIVEDKKMPPLFGVKGAAANPHAAKAWRSGRSERDIAQNLASLQQAYAALKPFAPEASASVIEKLQDASSALEAKDDPNKVITIVAAINNAKYYAIDVLPGEVGVALGFNSLDGD